MKRVVALAFLGLLLLSCTSTPPAGTGSGSPLAIEKMQLVRSACFEVVEEKPAQESLTYNKPLNWDLLNYASRNDHYIPLGTAFAIGPDELVSAAHVFELTPGSLVYKTRFIRERMKDGTKVVDKVFEVENIRAFSNNRDYVVFTVKGRTFEKWLNINRDFDFNTRIYTAGDAYGEGIVLREGVLLDETPEPENGAWHYLKSSIATNPGNSGGPLLNANCEVIGIVLMHKDDFCYSLPMKEIVPLKALMHTRLTLGFSVFKKQGLSTIDATWELPLPYRELSDKYLADYMEHYRGGMDKLLADNKGDLFPEGPNSERALYNYVDGTFPQIYLQETASNSWFCTELKSDVTNIGNNGSIRYAEIYKDESVWLLRLDKPTNVSVRELWESPKEAMDLVLKGINITRKLSANDEGSRILSYGAPAKTIGFADRFGRPWQLNAYYLEYSDQMVMTCATPTPQGLSMIYVARDSWQMDAWIYDMQKLTDFINISYYGTLADWDQYMKAFQSTAMKNVSISYKAGTYVDIDLGSVSMRIRQGLIDITRETELYLVSSVFLRDGRPVRDIRKMVIDTGSASSNDYLTFYRWTRPTDSLPDQEKDQWKKSILDRGHPYSGNVYAESGRMNVGMLHPRFVVDGKVAIQKDFAYTLFASKEGTFTEQQMKGYLLSFADGMQIAY